MLYNRTNEVTEPISDKKRKSNFLSGLFNTRSKKAIWCGSLSTLVFLSCVGTGFAEQIHEDKNKNGYGGALNITGTPATDDYVFNRNSAWSGGAVYVAPTGTFNFGTASFTGNKATYGGGGAIDNLGTIGPMIGSSFISNTAVNGGGAINNLGTMGVITEVSFDKNSGTMGGAIYNDGVNDKGIIGDITDSNFTDNKATGVDIGGGNVFGDNGGAIYITNGGKIGNITGSTFTGNTAGAGGAIYTTNYSTIGNIVNTAFTKNEAKSWGGAIYNYYTEIIGDITGSSFTENKAGADGGAIYNWGTIGKLNNVGFTKNNATTNGGAIFNASMGKIDSITESSFKENTAKAGAAIYNDRGKIGNLNTVTFEKNVSTGSGGAIYNIGTIGNLTNVTLSENEARDGGAIYHYSGTIGDFTGVIFEENSAVRSGGAIYTNTKIGTLSNVTFTGNTSGHAGGAIFSGGTIEGITKSLFTQNEATDHGGAIYNNFAEIKTITETDFTENKAGNGGAIYNNNKITMTDVNFIDNEATTFGGAIANYSELTIGAGVFSGNLASGVANSIYNDRGTLTINPGADEVLDMRDPMNGRNGTITKTGTGTWKLGGSNEFIYFESSSGRKSPEFIVSEGTLYLYKAGQVDNPNSIDPNAKVEKGDIILGGTDAAFVLESGATLLMGIDDEAHIISADKIDLQTGSKVGVDYDTAFVTSVNDKANDRHNVLVLDGADITNDSGMFDPTAGVLEFLEVSAYDYYNVAAEWNEDKDMLSLYIKDSSGAYNPDRGGSHAVKAPEAMAIHNPTTDIIMNRQKALFTDKEGMFGETKQLNRHFWGTPFYKFTNMDTNRGQAGYKVKMPGFAMGYDDNVSDKTFLGVAITAAWPDYDGGNVSADATDIRLALYGGTKLSKGWDLSYMAAYGWGDIDQDRYYGGYKYGADYDYDTLSLGIGIAKSFRRSETSVIRPYVHYEYLKVESDGYRESGSGEYGLKFDDKTTDLNRVRLGFDYIKEHSNTKGYWRAGLFWLNQTGDRTAKTRAQFGNDVNSRFMSYGVPEDENSLGVSIGYGTPIGKNSDFHLNYTGFYGSNSDSQEFSMTFTRRF
ncbi:autotransporter domain-containing protein [Selenomonadales bacterium OttesenSCG-928-I06]|nr:autotransporter domain-containing protein [Selenomonadales bacterium OttesenSCG-928-I06]